MLKTSISDYEKSSVVTYPFYFINRQSVHKTYCMQRIKKILMREVFPAIALNQYFPVFHYIVDNKLVFYIITFNISLTIN